MKSGEKGLKLLTTPKAIEVLRFIDQHGKTQYKDLKGIAAASTLNSRIDDLLELGVIECFKAGSESWYEITEKGKKALQLVEKMIQVIQEKNNT